MSGKNNKEDRVSARVPMPLKNSIERYVSADTHMTNSEFIRAALREKIMSEAPEILKEEIGKKMEQMKKEG